MESQRVGHDWATEQQNLETTGRQKAVKQAKCTLALITWSPRTFSWKWLSILVDNQKYPYFCDYICCGGSATKLCPILCDPMDCSTPGFSILSRPPGVCSSLCPLNRWCHPNISSSPALFSFCLQSFSASGSFPMSQLLTPHGKVLEFQRQHQSFQGTRRSLLQHHSSAVLSLLYGPTLTSTHDYWKKYIYNFDSADLCW